MICINKLIQKKIPFFLSFFSVLVFLFGCNNSQNDKLAQALKLAGDNSPELEKVIAHYSKNEADSLKLKAARFLIENMPGHFSVSANTMDEYVKYIEENHQKPDDNIRKMIYMIPYRTGRSGEIKCIEDIKNIKADYLIAHIDNAIDMFNSCYWLSNTSFEDFCDYVLPYRVDNEPLLPYNDSLMGIWKSIKKDIEAYNNYETKLEEVWLFELAAAAKKDNSHTDKMKLIQEINRMYGTDCLDWAIYHTMVLRTLGVPVCIDFIPAWADRNGGHTWKTVFDNKFSRPETKEVHSSAPKIYRQAYSHQPIPEFNGIDSIPELFRLPFFKDVTSEYINTADVELNFSGKIQGSPKHIYLSVFNSLGWRPIAWAEYKAGKAIFQNMGKNIVYQPLYYIKKQEQKAGYPVILHRNGTIEELKPDLRKTQRILIERKAPMTFAKVNWGESISMCRVEASNDVLFEKKDTLAVISQVNKRLGEVLLEIPSDKKYRYWRLTSGKHTFQISYLKFMGKDKQEQKGQILPAIFNDRFKAAFDGDERTFASGQSFEMDMGKPVEITEVIVRPRTDDNNVVPGQEYELLYYTENGWKALGRKVAENDFVEFENAPASALFWIRNRTVGVEERIFTCKGGKITWY